MCWNIRTRSSQQVRRYPYCLLSSHLPWFWWEKYWSSSWSSTSYTLFPFWWCHCGFPRARPESTPSSPTAWATLSVSSDSLYYLFSCGPGCPTRGSGQDMCLGIAGFGAARRVGFRSSAWSRSSLGLEIPVFWAYFWPIYWVRLTILTHSLCLGPAAINLHTPFYCPHPWPNPRAIPPCPWGPPCHVGYPWICHTLPYTWHPCYCPEALSDTSFVRPLVATFLLRPVGCNLEYCDVSVIFSLWSE